MSYEQKQAIIDKINATCEQETEYAENHVDYGNKYADMVGKSCDDYSETKFINELTEKGQKLGVCEEWKSVDSDKLCDIALQSFYMTPRHMMHSCNDVIVLDSFGIGEIEIQLESEELTYNDIMSVENDCECYISGTGLAYVTSDIVWVAALDIKEFNKEIKNHLENMSE